VRQVWPLAEAATAHRRLEAGGVGGKIVLSVNRSILTVLTTKEREVRFFTTLVDQTFLAAALTFYRNGPEARANIGTEAGLAHLRAGIDATAAQPFGHHR
jgi:hypothetical protein